MHIFYKAFIYLTIIKLMHQIIYITREGNKVEIIAVLKLHRCIITILVSFLVLSILISMKELDVSGTYLLVPKATRDILRLYLISLSVYHLPILTPFQFLITQTKSLFKFTTYQKQNYNSYPFSFISFSYMILKELIELLQQVG